MLKGLNRLMNNAAGTPELSLQPSSPGTASRRDYSTPSSSAPCPGEHEPMSRQLVGTPLSRTSVAALCFKACKPHC